MRPAGGAHTRDGLITQNTRVPAPDLPVITFLTDYGLDDGFVGICHAVIASICPAARVVDLTHAIARHDVAGGATVLADAQSYLPMGVQLAVVDPDVGAERRAVALRTGDGRTLVGPDNGLLWPAAQLAGGVVEAVDIAQSPCRLEPVSATFHGRDIFSPVAATLAAGRPLAEVGLPLDPGELVPLTLPAARLEGRRLIAHVRYIDRFGNLALDAGHEQISAAGLQLGRRVTVAIAGRTDRAVRYVRTFADAPTGELIAYEDAQQRLALAVSHGDAAQTLGLSVGAELRIRAS